MEEWKETFLSPLYEVSNKGQVRNAKTKRILSQSTINTGYKKIFLYKINKTILVHRLILNSFEPMENYESLTVEHKDGDKTNNSLDNLCWVTAGENNLLQKLRNNDKLQYMVYLAIEKSGEKRVLEELEKLT